MNIYIEYVVLNNLTVNSMILYLAGIVLRRKVSWWRIIASSTIGTIYATLLPFISFKYDIFLKIILSIIMALVAYKSANIKEYMRILGIFYIVTFFFGGIAIGTSYLTNYNIMNSLLYPNSLGATYISITIIGMAILFKYIIYVWRIRYNRQRYVYDIIIRNAEREVRTTAFLDTGNKLHYGIHPVVVLDKEIFDIVVDKDKPNEKTINVATVNMRCNKNVYPIEDIELIHDDIHKNYKGVYAILSDRQFNEYKVLLSSDM